MVEKSQRFGEDNWGRESCIVSRDIYTSDQVIYLKEHPMKIDGSCHCGKITLTAEVDPSTAMVCHCTDCQILGGGPCRTGIRSEAEKITIEGDVTEYTKVAESGRKRVQGFCGVCGTSLYAADADKQKFNIRLGFINQRDQLVPSKHIFGDSAASWLKQIEQHQWFARMP